MLLPIAFENSTIELPPGTVGRDARDSLLRATAESRFDVLEPTRRGLKACRAVGLIDTGRYQLEILPKTAMGAGSVFESRRLLLGLLGSSTRFTRYITLDALIAADRLPVAEAVVRSAVDDILQLLEGGAPRRYREVAEEIPTIRGRVAFAALARRPSGRDHLIPCRWAPLERDNPLSRLVLSVLLELRKLSRSAGTLAEIRTCIAAMPTVRRVTLTASLIEEATPTALESAWAPVVALGALLARGQGPNPAATGGLASRSFLFEMDRLFEDLLRRRIPLALTLGGAGLALARPSSPPLLEDTDTGELRIRLRPDFLFESDDVILMVGDAKWKRLNPRASTLGLRRSDVYQLTAYVARYALSRAVLMFPATSDAPSGWSRRHRYTARAGSHSDTSLVVMTVDVAGLVSHRRTARRTALAALAAGLTDAVTAGGSMGRPAAERTSV
jgi:5-methylcytosine-specific restriction enzyme subunit McrC